MNKMNETGNGNHAIDVDNLITRLQREDIRNKKTLKSVFTLYLVCTVFYAALFVLNPDPDLTFYDRLAGLFYVAAFVTGTMFFRKEYLAYNNIDYTIPLLQLLDRTEKRFRLLSPKLLIAIAIVVLIDLGISFSFSNPNRMVHYSLAEKLLFVQGFYWGTIFISGFIGYLIWRKRSFPIWKESKMLLEELNK
jgi:hypothetical protein